MGVSLWIVPCEKEAVRLKSIMSVRQNVPPLSKATYPKFYPHITLASLPQSVEGEADLDRIEESLRNFKKPVYCNFASVDIGSHYFRSVYVTIKLTPEIEELHRHVHDSLGVEPRTPSFPHMSLCYIDDTDAANGERERYYEELKSAGKVKAGNSPTENIELHYGPGGVNSSISRFKGFEIWVVRCEGSVEGWEVLRKVEMSSQ